MQERLWVRQKQEGKIKVWVATCYFDFATLGFILILSQAENLGSSSLQDGATELYYHCQDPADHLNV